MLTSIPPRHEAHDIPLVFPPQLPPDLIVDLFLLVALQVLPHLQRLREIFKDSSQMSRKSTFRINSKLMSDLFRPPRPSPPFDIFLFPLSSREPRRGPELSFGNVMGFTLLLLPWKLLSPTTSITLDWLSSRSEMTSLSLLRITFSANSADLARLGLRYSYQSDINKNGS